MFNCARIIPRRIISSDGERYLRGRSTKSPVRDRGENNKSQRAACFDENRTRGEEKCYTEREARVRKIVRRYIATCIHLLVFLRTTMRLLSRTQRRKGPFPFLPLVRARIHYSSRDSARTERRSMRARCASDVVVSLPRRRGGLIEPVKNALARLGLGQDRRSQNAGRETPEYPPVRSSDSLAESWNCTSRTPKYSPTRSLR